MPNSKKQKQNNHKKNLLLLRGHRVLFARYPLGKARFLLFRPPRLDQVPGGTYRGEQGQGLCPPSSPLSPGIPPHSKPTPSPAGGSRGFGEAPVHAPDRRPCPAVCPPGLTGLPQARGLGPQGRRPEKLVRDKGRGSWSSRKALRRPQGSDSQVSGYSSAVLRTFGPVQGGPLRWWERRARTTARGSNWPGRTRGARGFGLDAEADAEGTTAGSSRVTALPAQGRPSS